MNQLTLINANVMTMDPAMPKAGAVIIRNGVIAEVRENSFPEKRTSDGSPIIDCRGRTILPGFIDAHGHVQAYAESLVSVNLSPRAGVGSIRDLQGKIRQFAEKQRPGTWIRAKGYSEFALAEGRHPTRWELDAATSLHPVKLTHRSGHAHVLNSLALKLVGISSETGDPEGGFIDRDLETIEPTGILYGMGGYLAGRIPALPEEELADAVSLASQRLLSFGITSVQDASAYNDLSRWRQFERWKKLGIFMPRLTMMIGFPQFALSRRLPHSDFTDQAHLKTGGVKITVHEITGRLHPPQEALNECLAAIHEAGLQAVIHAVEEETITAACRAIECALRFSPRSDHRHRIEHCSLCPPHLMDRLTRSNIAVVTQPPFIYHNGDRYLRTVPADQREYLYPFGSMLRRGILVGAGSDFPIVDPDPLAGIYAAVTRMSAGGEVVGQYEGVTPMDAFKMYTAFAAASNFEEESKGSVVPGRVADLVMLSDDPFRIDARRIKDIQVEMTILGGRVVYCKDKA